MKRKCFKMMDKLIKFNNKVFMTGQVREDIEATHTTPQDGMNNETSKAFYYLLTGLAIALLFFGSML